MTEVSDEDQNHSVTEEGRKVTAEIVMAGKDQQPEEVIEEEVPAEDTEEVEKVLEASGEVKVPPNMILEAKGAEQETILS